MSPVRALLAVLVAAVMGAAIAGIGMGQAPAEGEPAPSAAELAEARQRIAASGARVRTGRATFADEGCDRCHSIAAIDAQGRLGPRLDILDEDADDIVESIVEPREVTVDGYSSELMPTDYAERLDGREVRALAAFIVAAAGTADEGGEHSGKGGNDSGRGEATPARAVDPLLRRCDRRGPGEWARRSQRPHGDLELEEAPPAGESGRDARSVRTGRGGGRSRPRRALSRDRGCARLGFISPGSVLPWR